MNISIRRCTLNDLIPLLNISYQTYDETFRPFNTEENMENYLSSAFTEDKIKGELLDPASEFYFMFSDDQLMGYMKLNEAGAQSEFNTPNSIELERIYILKSFQGHGLGQELLNLTIKIAKERGKSYIWLGVWENNIKALNFYTKNGFYQIGEHVFVMGDDPQIDFLLRKDLL